MMAAGVLELWERHLFGLFMALAYGALIGARLHRFGMVSGLLSLAACLYTVLHPADSHSPQLVLWPLTIGILTELYCRFAPPPLGTSVAESFPHSESQDEDATSESTTGRQSPRHELAPTQLLTLAMLLIILAGSIASLPSIWGYAAILAATITPIVLFMACE